MVLKRKTAEFEAPIETGEEIPFDTSMAEETAQAVAPTATSTGPAMAAPKSAVVPLGARSVSTKVRGNMNAVKELKGAYHVEWDSLASLTASQGRFAEKETNTSLGAEVIVELLSYQDQYVVTPNDNKAPVNHVRFSSDGVTCSDGTDVKQHLADLKELGYANPRVNSRYVLVFAVNAAEKSEKYDGQLMQIDLAPKSKGQFDRYLIQSAFDIGKGTITDEEAKVIRMTAEVAVNANKDSYTVVKFTTYKD